MYNVTAIIEGYDNQTNHEQCHRVKSTGMPDEIEMTIMSRILVYT
jgi:hypothetical protein